MIGVGNLKGGVGSTALTWNFAALVQRTGYSVAIAETATSREDERWCHSRCHGEGRMLGADMRDIGYFRSTTSATFGWRR